MTESGFEVIITCTNSRKLRKYMSDNLEGGIVDMCKAFDEWMDDCREEGIKKGESRFALLIQKLAEENRMSEILRAAENAALRKRLYKNMDSSPPWFLICLLYKSASIHKVQEP